MMTETPPRRPGLSLRRLLPVALVAVGAVIGYTLFGDYLTFEALRDNRETLIAWRDANYLGAAATFMALYVAVVAFSLPGATIMTLGGAFLFGFAAAAPMILVAATLGASLIFLAARHGFGEALHARLVAQGGQGTLARMERGLRENEVSYLLLMRLVPAVPFFIANLAPAFLGVSLRVFVLTTFFGIIPGTLVYVWIGAGLGEVFARDATPDLSILTEPQILGPLLALAALAALPIAIKALRRKEPAR
jgi:uncharacterized membrane protein YdjX (TVP38/TMEM64 family)